jgi:hypothetical protein
LIVPAVVFAGAGYGSGIGARLGIEASDMFGERRVWIFQQQAGGMRTAHSAFGSVDIYVEGVPDEQVVVDARVGIGDIAIRVNDDVSVEVRSRVDDGVVTLGGASTDGDDPVRIGPEGTPDVVVEAWVGRGDVNIDQYALDGPPAAPVLELEPILPQLDVPLTPVSEAVVATADGWFVLAEGAAVIGPDDVLVVGEQFTREDGVALISSPFGEFQLLPRGLLITPFGQVLDLHAIRQELAAEAPVVDPPATTIAASEPGPTTTAVAPPTTVPASPTGSTGG